MPNAKSTKITPEVMEAQEPMDMEASEVKSERITPETVETVNNKPTKKNIAKVHAQAMDEPEEQTDYPIIDFISDGTEAGHKLVQEIKTKYKKVLYFLPLHDGEKKGDYFPFVINGCKCYIPMGQMAYIPSNVAVEIDRSRNLTEQAGQDLKLTDDKPKGKYLGVFKKLN